MTLRGAALLLALAGAPTLAAEPPVRLVDPRDGSVQTLDSAAPASHIVFVATWCPPCMDELQALAQLEARWADRGYRLTLVAVRNRQDESRLLRFLEQRRPPGRLLFDADGQAQRRWSADALPTHVVLDASGREVVRAGALDDSVRSAIGELLAGRRRGDRR